MADRQFARSDAVAAASMQARIDPAVAFVALRCTNVLTTSGGITDLFFPRLAAIAETTSSDSEQEDVLCPWA